MRKKRKIIELSVDSALALMQEIYNDIVEQKNNASIIMKKMLAFMKEADDMSMIGPVIKEQQKILNDCTEKKISLVKLQNAMLKQNGPNDKNRGFSETPLTDEERKILDELIGGDDKESENNADGGKYTF